MSKIFVSYSRRNKEIVDRIVGEMERAGLEVWIDRQDIKAGDSWRVQIVQAIDTCEAFVLMLSAHSAVSENVHKEINLAQDSRRKTFVLMLERIQLPAEIRYQLSGLQFIDVEEFGYETSVQRLIETVNVYLSTVRVSHKTSRQAELVIEGIDLASFGADKQAQLLALVAQLANTDASKLKIASLAAGSVHAYVDMPEEAAFVLKTLALNRDKRFEQAGISALKLAGDLHFIQIASGAFTTTPKSSSPTPSRIQPTNLFSAFASSRMILAGLFIALLAALGILLPTALTPPVTPTSTLTLTPMPTRSMTMTPSLTSTVTSTVTLTLTPTETLTPTLTFTPTLDRSANSILVLLEGPTGDLQRCERIRFAASVTDPESVKQVIVRFHVGENEPTRRDFGAPDAELSLVNEAEQRWGGYFYDAISQYQRTTYWWFVVIDSNDIATFFYEPGKYNYFAREFGCNVIPQ